MVVNMCCSLLIVLVVAANLISGMHLWTVMDSVGTTVNAGAAVNTDADEQAPYITVPTAGILFQWPCGYGRIWSLTSKDGAAFWTCKNGIPGNSSRDVCTIQLQIRFVQKCIDELGSGGSNCCLETICIGKTAEVSSYYRTSNRLRTKEAVSVLK